MNLRFRVVLRWRALLFTGLTWSVCLVLIATQVHAQAPVTTLPNGRRISPAGIWTRTAPYPFAIAVRQDGTQLAVPCIGFPFALTVVDSPGTSSERIRLLPEGTSNSKDVEVDTGVAYAADGRHAFVSA